MKRARVFAGFSAVFLAAIASAAAYCDSFPSVEQELRAAPLVVVGTVRSVRDIIGADGDVAGTFYSVQVTEPLKGGRLHTLDVYSENSSGRFPMRVGVQYLIFAHPQVFEGIAGPQFAINNCGNSASLSEGRRALATVRRLTRPNHAMQRTAPRSDA